VLEATITNTLNDIYSINKRRQQYLIARCVTHGKQSAAVSRSLVLTADKPATFNCANNNCQSITGRKATPFPPQISSLRRSATSSTLQCQVEGIRLGQWLKLECTVTQL